jgi:transcriptional regulator with XRE-family HTH domain
VLADKTHHAICVEVARLLRKERERQGISRYAMAAKSGLSEQAIGYVERGLRNPSLETALRMAAGLEVDLGDILKQASRIARRST